jgi:radical SAM superfamily enzyme YgiQ (UPF0313 family)
LGLGYIAALTSRDWQIEFIDENFMEFVPRKADLVAISAMTVQINRAYEICNIYNKMGVPVVLGGIHASVVPEEALKYATSVVVGEAERLWPEVLEDFVRARLKPLYKNNTFPPLNNLIRPRRDIFSRKYSFDAIQTSRGCPFDCDFCSVPLFNGRKYRPRPVDEVVEELKTIKKKYVFFVDDNILGIGQKNEERALTLFEEIVRSGVKKYWISQASINIAQNETLLRLMKKSGCLGLLIGFESLDPGKLRVHGKTQNLAEKPIPEQSYRDIIQKLHKWGIAVNGYFCCGYEDTSESILNMTRFVTNSGLDIINTPIIIPSPGTSLFKKLYNKLEFKNFPSDWNHYLGRLVYTPKDTSKIDFYKAYILSVKKINSFREILKRSLRSLFWEGNLIFAFGLMLFNLSYRNLRKRGMAHLLQNDPDYKMAYLELKRGSAVAQRTRMTNGDEDGGGNLVRRTLQKRNYQYRCGHNKD